MKKLLAILLALTLLLGCASIAEEAAPQLEHDVVVLFTSDVHCGIEDAIGYAGLAAYEKAYEKLGYEVILVDNGDAIQGGPIGTLSKGEYLVDILSVHIVFSFYFLSICFPRFASRLSRAFFSFAAPDFRNFCHWASSSIPRKLL